MTKIETYMGSQQQKTDFFMKYLYRYKICT
jgi:hypothetical protein